MTGPAQIDESLAEAAARRERIVRLVSRLRHSTFNRLGLRRLGRQLRLLAPEAPTILVDYLVEADGAESDLILAVLPEMNDYRIRDRLLNLRKRAGLSAAIRARLEQARVAVEQQLAPFGLPDDLSDAHAAGVWRYVAGEAWATLPPEQLGGAWLENFFPQAQSLRKRLLGEALDRLGERLLPIAELEAHWGGKEMARWVIARLKKMRGTAAAELLSRLCYHREPDLREVAASALGPAPVEVRTAAGGAAGGAPGAEDAYELFRCYMTEEMEPARTPPASVAASTAKKAARGAKKNAKEAPKPPPRQFNLMVVWTNAARQTKILGAMIDLRERGFIECFGSDRFDLPAFYELLEMFNAEHAGGGFRQIPTPLGLMLANGAAALGVRGRVALPKEFYLWRDLVATAPYDASGFSVRFGQGQRDALGDWLPAVLRRGADSPPTPW